MLYPQNYDSFVTIDSVTVTSPYDLIEVLIFDSVQSAVGCKYRLSANDFKLSLRVVCNHFLVPFLFSQFCPHFILQQNTRIQFIFRLQNQLINPMKFP